MAIMMVVIGFSQAFQDMGISNAIIQRQSITHTQLSSLYWLNIASGVVLSLIVLAISPFVADFYDEPRITGLMAILSSVFVLVAIGNQYRVLCQKELDFRTMETINVVAAIAALAVAITLAIQGVGVLTLVVAMLTQAGLASALFLWVGLRCYHKPSLVYKHSELSGFYGFGLYQMAEQSINYISTNSDKLLIGKLVGLNAAGFYSLAWQLIIFPVSKINPIVNKVAFPVYSKVQDDPATLNRYYSFNIKFLSIVTMPLLAFLAFFSHEVVYVVFGEGWSKTADLVPALAMIGIIRALGNPGGAIILSQGRADVGFWWNLGWAVCIVTALTGSMLVLPSAQTAVYVLLCLYLTVGMIWHVLIAKIGKVEYGPIAKHFLKLFVVVMSIGWLGALLTNLIDPSHAFLRILVGGLICALFYGLYLYLFEKPIFRMLKRTS
ncbi:PST family polysaccharide transporter/teichuronic acid exporter [Pseudidiomarina tainanensis]|uniref:PST family polysaccharide transporter/teichuronic acid exporter n=3 Tax=Idiomarinaceae TaxID=267893 RepID=A0A368UMC7_9GAMM|nr:PST family polysaccharide transporter/teichuronic acid exporter [Pseudidiomarina maritima]RBP87913.1 PST family polysaccharide transporter/teichuronic acid exporter [Pseudidiomarina tainanensis]RCW29968.1 PST family polysaccharide transporter/teichuronic acid exporter [Pseudidiomarina tainanensis]